MRALCRCFGFCKILDIVKLHIVTTTLTILSQTIYIAHPYIQVEFISVALLCLQRYPRKHCIIAVHKRHLLAESECASHSARLLFVSDVYYVV